MISSSPNFLFAVPIAAAVAALLGATFLKWGLTEVRETIKQRASNESSEGDTEDRQIITVDAGPYTAPTADFRCEVPTVIPNPTTWQLLYVIYVPTFFAAILFVPNWQPSLLESGIRAIGDFSDLTASFLYGISGLVIYFLAQAAMIVCTWRVPGRVAAFITFWYWLYGIAMMVFGFAGLFSILSILDVAVKFVKS